MEIDTPVARATCARLRSFSKIATAGEEVDATESADAKEVVSATWEKEVAQPRPDIFWEFIYKERNNIVKTYNFGVRVNSTVRPGGGGSPSEPTTFAAFMRSGPFAGRDALQLCRDAINFWKAHLDSIDRQIEQRLAARPP